MVFLLRERGILRNGGVAQEVGGGVVRQKGHAGVGEHAQHGRGEAAVKVDESFARRDGLDGLGGLANGVAYRAGRIRQPRRGRLVDGLFVVYLAADGGEGRAALGLCLKRQADSDDLEGVCEEDGRDARQTAADEPAERRLVLFARDHSGSYLFIGEELDAGVGEDSEECRRVAAEQAARALEGVNVLHGGQDAK